MSTNRGNDVNVVLFALITDLCIVLAICCICAFKASIGSLLVMAERSFEGCIDGILTEVLVCRVGVLHVAEKCS